MELILLWMTIGMFAAFIGKSKGRYGFRWFVLFLVLGPFGFIVAFLPDKKQ